MKENEYLTIAFEPNPFHLYCPFKDSAWVFSTLFLFSPLLSMLMLQFFYLDRQNDRRMRPFFIENVSGLHTFCLPVLLPPCLDQGAHPYSLSFLIAFLTKSCRHLAYKSLPEILRWIEKKEFTCSVFAKEIIESSENSTVQWAGAITLKNQTQVLTLLTMSNAEHVIYL